MLCGEIAKVCLTVIASVAKQSILPFLLRDGLLRFARNDGRWFFEMNFHGNKTNKNGGETAPPPLPPPPPRK
jgi:hypothetical protein